MSLVVLGAAGRMGRMLVRAIVESGECRLAGAIAREGSRAIGQDAGTFVGTASAGVEISSDLAAACREAEGVIDFTNPAATVAAASSAARHGLVHVVGTTGLDAAAFAALRSAASTARIVQSGNMSLGVNLLAGLVRKAAASLGPDFDIEIVEMHHRMKVDAPSGTALLLGEAAAEGRAVDLAQASVKARDGHVGMRTAGQIGFASLRGGTVVGDHSVVFAGTGERIELAHRAEDRGVFVQGALRAALWARSRRPGYYGMADVVGL